jgi:uncharacterized protein
MKQCIITLFIALFLSYLPGFLYANSDIDTDLSGIWSGAVAFPAFEYRIILIISSNDDISAQIVFPDQSESQTEVDIMINYPHIEVTSQEMQLSFKAVYNNHMIKGNWEQMNRKMPLVLKQIDEIEMPARLQTPKPPFPYLSQEIVFGHDGLSFSGTLTIPDSSENCSAVILIPGVGTHDRDNTFFGHKPFFVIADYLTRQGIAVLRYDEIQVRKNATTSDFAIDVKSAVSFLQSKEYICDIGLIGHSEGGLIASIVAAEDPALAFIILLGSPGLKGDEYNCQFEASMSRAMGASEIEIEQKLKLQRAVISVVSQNISDEEAEKQIIALYRDFDSRISSSQIDAAIQRFLSPWFKYSIRSNPGDVLQKVSCPVLAIFAEKDWQVPSEGNMSAVINALESRNNIDFEVIEMLGLNHYMQNAITGKPDEYGKIEESISVELLEHITSWISER